VNIYTPNSAKDKFPDWDFRGKPFLRKGRKWIRAKSRTFYYTWYYCFDTDSIYDGIYSQDEISIM
jgi:hypothetical protein